jgi:hypothetical protein
MSVPESLLKKQAALVNAASLSEVAPEPSGEPTSTVDAPVPEPAPVAVVDPTPAPVPTPASTVTPTQTYEQQWRTAQGMLDAASRENRSLKDEVDKLTDRTKELLGALDTLMTAQKQTPSPVPVAEPPAPIFTDEDATTLGDILTPIDRLIQERIASFGTPWKQDIATAIEAVKSELAQVATQVKGVAEKTAKSELSAFEQALKDACPEYLSIHSDPNFAPWLASMTDERSGQSYIDLYNQAVTKTFNAKSAALFMKEYQQAFGIAPAASIPVAPPIPAQAPVSSSPPVPPVPVIPEALRDQIAPARSSNAGDAGANAPVPRITLDDLSRAGIDLATRRRMPDGTFMTQDKFDALKKQYYNQEEAARKR